MNAKDSMDDLKKKLQNAQNECTRLEEENIKLKNSLYPSRNIPDRINEQKTEYGAHVSSFPMEDQIKIFKNLFRGREDVFAVRWISKKGRTGYSPACVNEWDKELCRKPQIKCYECNNREHIPLTDSIISNHLAGKQTIGIYPLLPDETSWFLAVDFDKSSWKMDASTYLSFCSEMGIPASLERSRSGDGCHVWIFFEENIPAALARKLGAIILTKALEKRYQIGFNSYDRFFPNQDTMPKGGYGNLLALPLQKVPRENGNSIFLNSDFQPYQDQWSYLSSIKKMPLLQLSTIVNNNQDTETLGGIRTVADPDKQIEDDPWTLPPSKKKTVVFENLPVSIRVVQGNLLYVEKKNLSSKVLKHLLGLAAFQNPEFYKAQRMRLSTFGKPRIISCGDNFPEYIGLPRGSIDELLAFFKEHGIKPVIEDKCFIGNKVKHDFHAELRPAQKEAAKLILKNDIGILSAGTAFGKTVVAIHVMVKRGVNTLILVHRKQLLEQWVKMLSSFLGISEKSIGKIGGGKNKITGIIDVALIQSLYRKGIVKDFVADYGQVIVDECHHVSAFSFEQVMKQAKAKYVLGLTATPIRKDGRHPIIIMQCGPIRFRVSEKTQALERGFEHQVIPRYTDFNIPDDSELTIQNIYQSLCQNTERNEMIIQDILKAIKEQKSPLLLTERTEHLEYFRDKLNGLIKNIFVFRGGMGKKQFNEIYDKLLSLPDNEERLILSTGRYIGEGFDDKRLDVLFLALPISWRGTLAQYVGRLHRFNDNKRRVMVFDYVDAKIPMVKRMYDKRIKGYKALGYNIIEPENDNPQMSLFEA